MRDIYHALRSLRKPVMEALCALEEDGCVVRVELPPKPDLKSEADSLAEEPCEAEFDALLAQQKTGRLVAAVILSSVTVGLR